MSITLILLAALSFQAAADANQITFAKIKETIFAETGPQNYVMLGRVSSDRPIQIMTLTEQGRYQAYSDCHYDWRDIKKIGAATLRSYDKIRDSYLSEKRSASDSPNSFIWSDTYSDDQREFSVVRIDPETLVYSSRYFPSKLARVIISGQAVIFIHHDGVMRMKTKRCLFMHERILVDGIEKTEPDANKSLFSGSSADKVLKKYLDNNAFKESKFELEQDYMKTYTDGQLAAMQRGVLGGGTKAFDGLRP